MLKLFESYLALQDLEKKRQFLYKHLKPIKVMYRYVQAKNPRKENYAFYFEVEGVLKRVCKTMVKNTLDINDRPIRTVIDKSEGVFLKGDQRGRRKKHFTVCETIKNKIRVHIKSIPKIESHYLRAQISREYIDGGKTITDLHRDYVDQCKRDGC
ncbi:unnamed protein product [Diabrotica balteata]|uniref:Uncharacterized protein n=1 Tax=Diabrotica balteata TaxID=107213 RepID=A0A9N9T357_DIABA|nr:unnamed protein product [Diabrotica balteata]